MEMRSRREATNTSWEFSITTPPTHTHTAQTRTHRHARTHAHPSPQCEKQFCSEDFKRSFNKELMQQKTKDCSRQQPWCTHAEAHQHARSGGRPRGRITKARHKISLASRLTLTYWGDNLMEAAAYERISSARFRRASIIISVCFY